MKSCLILFILLISQCIMPAQATVDAIDRQINVEYRKWRTTNREKDAIDFAQHLTNTGKGNWAAAVIGRGAGVGGLSTKKATPEQTQKAYNLLKSLYIQDRNIVAVSDYFGTKQVERPEQQTHQAIVWACINAQTIKNLIPTYDYISLDLGAPMEPTIRRQREALLSKDSSNDNKAAINARERVNLNYASQALYHHNSLTAPQINSVLNDYFRKTSQETEIGAIKTLMAFDSALNAGTKLDKTVKMKEYPGTHKTPPSPGEIQFNATRGIDAKTPDIKHSQIYYPGQTHAQIPHLHQYGEKGVFGHWDTWCLKLKLNDGGKNDLFINIQKPTTGYGDVQRLWPHYWMFPDAPTHASHAPSDYFNGQVYMDIKNARHSGPTLKLDGSPAGNYAVYIHTHGDDHQLICSPKNRAIEGVDLNNEGISAAFYSTVQFDGRKATTLHIIPTQNQLSAIANNGAYQYTNLYDCLWWVLPKLEPEDAVTIARYIGVLN